MQTVRQRGGDCLESVRQRVRVVREEEAAAGVQLHEVPDTAAEDRARAEAQRSAAEERGREAARRLEQDHWLEERLARAEAERKEAVKLTEMLRTARILSQVTLLDSYCLHFSIAFNKLHFRQSQTMTHLQLLRLGSIPTPTQIERGRGSHRRKEKRRRRDHGRWRG